MIPTLVRPRLLLCAAVLVAGTAVFSGGSDRYAENIRRLRGTG